MSQFYRQLFDTEGFPPRWTCGQWSEGHGWLHILSDVAIFGAYAAIPLILVYFIRKRRDVPFVPLFGLFALFIVCCGLTHLIDASLFWQPWYRLSGTVKAITAVVSWMTVVALFRVVPQALNLPGLAKINRQLLEEISEREQAEAARHESEEKLRFVAERAQVGYWHWDLAPDRLEWSPQCKELFGIPLTEEVTYARFLGAVHPDDRSRTEQAVAQCLEGGGGTDYDIELRVLPGDGTVRWVHSKGSAVYQDGKAVRMAGIAMDITVRKTAEAALRENAQLFATLIEHAPGGVYVVDEQFRIQSINSKALPVFASVHPLVGRDFREVMEILWGRETGGRLADIFQLTLTTGVHYISPPFQATRRDLGVEQAYDWEVQRITLPDGRFGAVCYFTDVTERHRAEAALQQAKEAAEAANRSKDHFLAVLSHELRTPLTPVLIAAGELEHHPDLPAGVREEIGMIKRNVELETKLIDDLLDLSRITSGKVELKPETVELEKLVREVCAICRSELSEKGIALEVHPGPEPCRITADPARLHQVLWNVMRNAIKFTPEGGQITVRMEVPEPGWCELRVRDNGIGIPPELLGRVFHAFDQGDARITRQFGGLGLGLAISRALIELHGGRIRAESAGAGEGATFILDFPLAGGPPPGAPAAAPPSALPMRPGLRLLLVEDHADTAATLGRLLGNRGMTVVTAGTVADAVEAARREPFDLLLSDLGLPDGSGYDVIHGVRGHQLLPAIAMSGYGMEEDLHRSAAAGFEDHLIKPIPIEKLMTAIRRLMEQPSREISG